MKNAKARIVAVGASAGGLAALPDLLSSLPADFSAAVLVVRHMAADVTGDILLRRLSRNCSLTCMHADDGEPIVPGCVYLRAPIIIYRSLRPRTCRTRRGD